ncbi:hypothetical protein JYB64_26470, partial [Algoriphagus aestuarii]|nr:hypothetical protein [Algoriphagus aestuarii]
IKVLFRHFNKARWVTLIYVMALSVSFESSLLIGLYVWDELSLDTHHLVSAKDFSTLVLISNLIAWPVAYFSMQRWLENFAYRIDLTPVIFIGSG